MTNSEESRLDRLERLQDRTQQQVDANSQAIATMLASMQQLIVLQQQESQQFNTSINSIHAALERIDRVMDYLLRQQGGQTE